MQQNLGEVQDEVIFIPSQQRMAAQDGEIDFISKQEVFAPEEQMFVNQKDHESPIQVSPEYQPVPSVDNKVYPLGQVLQFQKSSIDIFSWYFKNHFNQLFSSRSWGDVSFRHSAFNNEIETPQVWHEEFTRELTEEEKQEAQVSNVYSGMVFCRRVTRLVLSLIVLGSLVGFFIWVHQVTLRSGEWTSKQPYDTLLIQNRNCLINITDTEDYIKFEYMTKGEFLKQASDHQVISTKEKGDGSLELNFINPISDITYCFVDLKIPKQLAVLQFLCLNSSQCVVTSHMGSLTATQLLNISAEVEGYIEINLKDIQTAQLYVKSSSAGTLILNHVIANMASIDLTAGDIIIQSSQDYTVDFTSNEHAFCMSGPQISSTLYDCYINNATKTNKENKLQCRGKVNVCSLETCQSAQSYKISANSANLYANRLKSPGKPYAHDQEFVTLLKSGQFQQPIEFNQETKTRIINFLNDTISDADVALRIDVGGSLFLQQAASTHWAYFSNPSYASFKPWWLSVFSATFLNPQFKQITASLNPGFCPWYSTSPTIGQLYGLQLYMNEFFNKTYGKSIYLRKDNRPLPREALDVEQTFSGIETLPSKPRNQYEDWLIIQKTANILSFEPLRYESSFIAVIVLSVASSLVFGIMAIYVFIFLLQKIEDYILQVNSQFLLYSATAQKGGQMSLNKSAKLMIKKLDLNNSEKDPPALQTIFTYLWYTVAQSIAKDSTELFCETFFKKSNPTQTQDFYAQVLDDKYLRIDQWKFKEKYEKFCFLNQLKIDQTDTWEQLLKRYNFKILENSDSMFLSKVKVNPKRKPYKQMSEKERTSGDSLELFMSTQMLITGVPGDIIEFSQLESMYTEFCGNTLQKQQVDIKSLEKKYSLAVSEQKAFEIKKLAAVEKVNRSYRSSVMKALGRCTYYIPLIDDYEEQPQIYLINADSEIFNFITNPIKTLSKQEKIRDDWRFNFLTMFLESIRYNYKRRIFNRIYYQLFSLDHDDIICDSFDFLYMSGWLITDLIIVTGNMVITIISLLPIGFFIVVFITSYTPYSVFNPKFLISTNDILVRPYSLFQTQYQIDEWTIAGAILIVCYGGITIIFQNCQYFLSDFPEERSFMHQFKLFQNSLMKGLNYFQYYQFLLLMFLVFIYFGLVVVWLILGAIINPTNYLVYSSSALTLVTTISTEYSSIKQLYQQACQQVGKLINELYLHQFSYLATNLIKEVWRVSDDTVNLIGSSGMDHAKSMAEQFGFGEEVKELCAITQNMLDNNVASTLETDQQNFNLAKDKFLQKAQTEFQRILRDKFKSVPDPVIQYLIKSNFLRFEEVVDVLADQVQIFSKNKVPASLVKWLQQTIGNLNIVMAQSSASEKRKKMQTLLPPIVYSLIDATLNGFLLNSKDTVPIFESLQIGPIIQSQLQSIARSYYAIIKDRSPLKMLKKVQQMCADFSNEDSRAPLQIVEIFFNFYEALKQPTTNKDFLFQKLVSDVMDTLKLDPDISLLFRYFFLGQRQFIEDGKVLSAQDIAAYLIHMWKSHFLIDLQAHKLRRFLALTAIQYEKNENLPVLDLIELLVPEDYQRQMKNLIETNKENVNAALSFVTLATKDWSSQLFVEEQGLRTNVLKELLLLGTKSLWSSRFMDKKQEIFEGGEQKEGEDVFDHGKGVRFGVRCADDRAGMLLDSYLIQLVSSQLGMDQASTIGLILFLRGDNLKSDYVLSFCDSIQRFIDPRKRSSSQNIAKALQIYSCRHFDDLYDLLYQSYSNSDRSFADIYSKLVKSSTQNKKIFNYQRNFIDRSTNEDQQDHLEVDEANGIMFLFRRLFFIRDGENQRETYDDCTVNFFKSGQANFLTFLRSVQNNTEIEKRAKNTMLSALTRKFKFKHDYLIKLAEIQQSLYSHEKLDLNLPPGLKVEPFQALLQIMNFKDPIEVCAGLKYFLDRNPSELQDQIQTIQYELQIFVEVENILASIAAPKKLPYYLHKLTPLLLNNFLGTRAKIDTSLYFDCMDLFFHQEKIKLSTQRPCRNYMNILFNKEAQTRKTAITWFLRQRGVEDDGLKVADFAVAVADKDYEKIMDYLAVYSKYIEPLEFQAFFQKVALIIKGLTTILKSKAKSVGPNQLVLAFQYLKYFIPHEQEVFQDFYNASFQLFDLTTFVKLNAIEVLFSIFSDKPDLKALSSLLQIEEDFIRVAQFLVDAMIQKNKSKWLKNPANQEMIHNFLNIPNLDIITQFSDCLEQNLEVPELMKWLDLDSDQFMKQLFSTFIYFKIQPKSTATWYGNLTRYNELVQRRQRTQLYEKSAKAELVLWFASPRPIVFLYQKNTFVTGNVSYMFAVIAAMAKHDFHDRYVQRQADYIKFRARQIESLSFHSHSQALLFIANSCQKDLIEAFLILQLATGINPVLTGARMGVQCLEDEILRYADTKTKKLALQAFERLENFNSLNTYDRLYIVEYEFVRMAAKFEQTDERLLKGVEAAKRKVGKLLLDNEDANQLDIVTKFISGSSKGHMQRHFPLSSLILLDSLSRLRQVKKVKCNQVAQYLKAVHFIDLSLTIFERYSYYFDPKQLQMINKPVLTRILSFGLFDSEVLRASKFNQEKLENLLYPGISDPFMHIKCGIDVSLLDGVAKCENKKALARHYLSMQPEYEKVLIPIMAEDLDRQQKQNQFGILWFQLLSEGEANWSCEKEIPEGFRCDYVNFYAKDLQLKEKNDIGAYYASLENKLLGDGSVESTIKDQSKMVQHLQSLDLEKFGFLRTKYLDKAFTLLRIKLSQEYLSEEQKQKQQRSTSKLDYQINKYSPIIIKLLNYYACNQQMDGSEFQPVDFQNPRIFKRDNSQGAIVLNNPALFKMFMGNDEPIKPKSIKPKMRKLTNKKQLVNEILSIKLSEEQLRKSEFFINLLFHPSYLEVSNFSFLWDGQDTKITTLIIMMIRKKLEDSRQDGEFQLLASNVPFCFLYYSIGDQFESKDIEMIKGNVEVLRKGLEKLIDDCSKIDSFLKVKVKLLVGCYLGDIEAWFQWLTQAAFNQPYQQPTKMLLSNEILRIFILELLKLIKNQGLRNSKLSRRQVASQSFHQILANAPGYKMKDTIGMALMQTFQILEKKDKSCWDQIFSVQSSLQKLTQAQESCTSFLTYLDFVLEGNIAVLKQEDQFYPIMRSILNVFFISNWQRIKIPFLQIMYMICQSDGLNNSFLLQEEPQQIELQLQPQDNAWNLTKLMLEVQRSQNFEVCIQKLLEFNGIYEFPELKPYINAMTGVGLLLNLKHYSKIQSRENLVGKNIELINLMMTPVCWVLSTSQPTKSEGQNLQEEQNLLDRSINSCANFVQDQKEQNDKLQKEVLDCLCNIEPGQDIKSGFFTDDQHLMLLNDLKNWCQKNSNIGFHHVISALEEGINTAILDLNVLFLDKNPPLGTFDIRNLILAYLKKQNFEYQMEQFLKVLKDKLSKSCKLKQENLEIIWAATFGLAKSRQAQNEELISVLINYDSIAQTVFYAYESNDDTFEYLQQFLLTLFINKDKYISEHFGREKAAIREKDAIREIIVKITKAALAFAHNIEEIQEVKDEQLFEKAQPLFELVFEEQTRGKDLDKLKISVKAFTAIKQKRFSEINLEFFQIFGENRQNSQLLVKQMQDFHSSLKSPIEMIQEKLEQFKNPIVVRQMQTMKVIHSKLNDNKELQFEDMFKVLNKNGDRFVQAPLVLEFLRRIHMNITDHKFIEILVNIKQEQVINLENCAIDAEEFKEIMEEISNQTMELTLHFLNMSKGLLAKSLMLLTIYLILVIAFILIGVQAFAIPGTFASLVNSILPMIGGLSLSRASSQERINGLKIERIKEFVKKAIRILQTTKI